MNQNSKSKFEKYAKDDLIKYIKKLERKKQFGLVWSDISEDTVEQLKQNIPILRGVEKKQILMDKNSPTNILIEGDNYHSLSVLNYTHAKQVDVIYIDPPYNIGKDTV